MSLWTRVRQSLDYLSGRYDAFEVDDPADRDAALALLDRVRRQELKRVHGSGVLESAAFADVEVDDVLLACRDTRSGDIIGCVRATPADQLRGLTSSRAEYALDRFDEEMLPRVSVATRLAVAKEHRGSVGSLVLLEYMYAEGVRRGYAACVLTCEPGLYATYLRLGFRPYDRVHASPTGGWRIPMVLPTHDLDHLERVGSPLAKILRRLGGPDDSEGVRWFESLERIDVGIAPFAAEDDPEIHHALTRGVSDDGITQLLANAHEVTCESGQVVIRQGDGSSGLAMVQSGLVEVRTDGRTLAMLGEGELLGEVAAVLGTPRSADVVAVGDDTTVLVLSRSAIDRVSDPADRERLWRNLAAQLASRLVAANVGSSQ